ncbi:MAG TPA: glycosyltransferase, partial [Actinotalea sp.]|nr:glycosyltransferase [Actinotalea sp.]
DSVDAVARVVDVAEPSHLWAALAVLRAELPTVEEVTAARRRAELDGAGAVLAAIVRDAPLHTAHRTVQAVVDATVVDLGDMLTSTLGTGIQRVARNVAAAWDAVHPMVVAGWTDDFGALRAATPAERSTALTGARAGSPPGPARPREHARRADTVLVPWRSTYLLPELAIQPRRCAAIQGLAQLSGNSTGVIGFDCVPITSSETSAGGFPDAFARNLAAVAHFDVVAAISGAAAGEYRGWARMLEGAGLTGPRVVEVPLPAQAPEPSAADLAAARARLTVPGLDMVLVVGSHEPRKNHLAVLHAAETAWRRGHRFSLVFVGGNAWGSEEFVGRLESLRSAGHPFESVSKMPDSQLWAAYRLARFTAFPSLNEGFG